MTEQEAIIQWLKDAHAMETSVEKALKSHARDASHEPPGQRHLERHIEETREHANSIRLCLEANGEEISSMKSVLGDAMGKIQGMTTKAAEDELVKNFLSDYATEHFEIACYKSLIAAAERAGMEDVAAVCRGILAEEEEMAEWLSRQIPLITEQFLDQQGREDETEQPRRRAAGG